MKKLIILQTVGVLLFIGLCVLLKVFGYFSLVTVIILYSLMGVCNVLNARNLLLKPIENNSIHDKLTGCYNRVKLDSKIPEYENYKSYAIIFFDLNNFKQINDKYGHDVGDTLLIKASNELRYWHRYGDLFRLGGDEFIVVVPNMTAPVLEHILTRWFDALPALNADMNDDFVCNFSYGTFYKDQENDFAFNTIMSKADEKMYKMKKKTKTEIKKITQSSVMKKTNQGLFYLSRVSFQALFLFI